MRKLINRNKVENSTKQNLKYQIKSRNGSEADFQDFINENLRLKKLLKRAVEKEFAPQNLINSIRQEIRR